MAAEKSPGTSPAVPAVFAAIAAVRAEINAEGIAKDKEANGGGIKFKFRGIDATLDTFSGPMLRAQLMLIPSYDEPVVTPRTTKNDGNTYNTVVRGSYKLVSTLDGSEFQLGTFYGEANDTQDKSFAKAQSIALRQAYLQTFIVPLGAEYDPEATEHPDEKPARQDAAPGPQQREQQAPPQDRKPAPAEDSPAITGAQQNILNAKLKTKGLTIEGVNAEFGKVSKGNYNDIMDWIKAQ